MCVFVFLCLSVYLHECVCVCFECLTLHAGMRLTFHRVCGCVEEREGPLAAGRGLVLRAPPAGQLELGVDQPTHTSRDLSEYLHTHKHQRGSRKAEGVCACICVCVCYVRGCRCL